MTGKKRESLCADAINEPITFLRTTWIGLVMAFLFGYLAWHLFGLKATMTVVGVSLCLPIMIARAEPNLFSVFVRNIFYSEFYDSE